MDMLKLERHARVILTDSGGVQKEASWLRVPCVTLREETEWVETVESGWNTLTGSDSRHIIRAVKEANSIHKSKPERQDKSAARNLVRALRREYLNT